MTPEEAQRFAALEQRIQELENMQAVFALGSDFLRVGADVGDPTKTALVVALVDADYDGETLTKGTALLGNSTGVRAKFIPDTGSEMTAGGGVVQMDANGISIAIADNETASYKIVNAIGDSASIVRFYGLRNGTVTEGHMRVRGVDATHHEAYAEIRASTDDNNPHAGAGTVNIILRTSDDTVRIGAGTLVITGGITHGATVLLTTTSTLSNGAAAQVGTLTNAPTAGNPTKWISIIDNGTTRYIPTWT